MSLVVSAIRNLKFGFTPRTINFMEFITQKFNMFVTQTFISVSGKYTLEIS